MGGVLKSRVIGEPPSLAVAAVEPRVVKPSGWLAAGR